MKAKIESVKSGWRHARKLLGKTQETFSDFLKYPGEEMALWREVQSMSGLLPYRAYDEETQLFFMKKSVGFCFEISPIVGTDEAFEEELNNMFSSILKEGECLQFFLFADHRTDPFIEFWQSSREKESIYSTLAKKRAEFFKNRTGVCSRLFRCVVSFSKEIDSNFCENEEKSVCSTRDTLSKVFSQFTHVEKIDAKAFLNFCDVLMSYDPQSKGYHFDWNPQETLSNQMCSGRLLEVDEDQLKWEENDCCLKTFHVTEYPRSWSFWQMQKFIGDEKRESYCYNEPFYLHYAIYVPEQEKASLKLNMRISAVEKQAQSSFIAKYIPGLAKEYKDCNSVRHRIAEGEKIVKTYFGVGIFSPQKDLDENTQLIESIFRSNRFSIRENRYMHLVTHLASLPMAWSQSVSSMKELNFLKTTLSSECVNMVPLQAEWHGTSSPGMLLLGRRGQIATWSPFDNQNGNYNACVVGTSGSGKSVFMQELVCSTAGGGGRCVVIDNGNSFEKLCKLIGGQHMDFGTDLKICLNPFSLVTEENKENTLVLITRCVSAMASPKGRLTEVEEGLIERAVHTVWQKEGKDADIQSLSNYFESSEDPAFKNIAVMLTSFGKSGNYGRYFCGKNNISLNRQVVVAELKALEDKPELRNVILMMLLMSVYNDIVMGDRKTPYMIVIDEAWALLSGEISRFIDKLSRTLRKYKGSLVIAAQNLKDFIDFPAAKVAYANSDWKCLLRCPVVTDEEAKELGLEGEKYSLPTLKKQAGVFSEAVISSKSSMSSSVVQLRVDPFSNLLYSTTPEEFSKIQTLTHKGYSCLDAIDKILEERK